MESGRLEDPQTWNRYVYVRNNPTRYLDPNGEDTLDAVLGFVNGLTSSVAFNIGRVDAETQNEDFAIGQTVGDAAATAAGLVVTGFGLTLLGGEGAVTVASGGTALPVTVPAAVVTVAGTALGATAAVNGAANTGKGLANLAFKKGDKSTDYSDAQREHFQRTLDRGGVPALEKPRKSIEGNLKEHLEKIKAIKEAGGKTSSLEREVRNWERELKAIDDILREQQ